MAFTLSAEPGNVLDLAKLERKSGAIRIIGTGNLIQFGDACIFRQATIRVQGNHNVIRIGDRCVIRGDIQIKGERQTVSIGAGTTFVGVSILSQEGCDVSIGRACMLSRAIEIRTTDAHSLIDRATRQRLNLPASVRIGDHVWIGLGVLVGKGAVIPSDSVVAAKSFVNRAFAQPGVLLAGTPARVMREGITWHRGRKSRFAEEELQGWSAMPPA